MEPVRILVAEESPQARRRLVELFSRAPGFQVVAEAEDGARAVELCRRLRPSVVTLDLGLKGLDGLEATARIMEDCPTPIIIVAPAEGRTAGLRTLDALSAGAVAAVERPAGPGAGDWEAALVARVRLAARVRVLPLPRARPRPEPLREVRDTPTRLVAMGASTGGPLAVRDVLRGLPADFPLPVLLVVHIAERFDATLARWLEDTTGQRVRHATDGEPLPMPGQAGVWMAPAGWHLAVRGGRLRLETGPERHSCRPSVDVLFESLAREVGAAAAGCLLTGMGQDGAEGLLALRRVGAPTLAQDEATSTVFGMPREAILLGAASHVAPLGDIAPWLTALARPQQARRLA